MKFRIKDKVVLCIIGIIAIFLTFHISSEVTKVYVAKRNVQYNVVLEGVGQETMFGPDMWIGSGVIINEEGLVLTAKHCVEGAKYLQITIQGGKKFIITSWYQDDKSDFAFFYIPIKTPKHADFGDSNDLKSGDKIYNIGNAKGIWDNTVIFGKVYRTNFERLILGEDTDFIFAKMTVYGGCSGGGVYYKNLLVGIAVMGGDGVTFIVPISKVLEVLEKNNIIVGVTDLR